MDTQSKIAARLEACFSKEGFTEPGVDALKDAAGVSLRTLYKYFPSREDMIIGALEHRHQTYLAFLDEGRPDAPGRPAVLHFYERVGDWMTSNASQGCLFVTALASHPKSTKIYTTLSRHKAETRASIAKRLDAKSSTEDLTRQLMFLHEGLTALAVSVGGKEAKNTTLSLVNALFPEEDSK